MSHIDEHAEKEHPFIAGSALLILPAVVLGVLAMIHGGVSPARWVQQIAAWAVFALLAWPLRRVAGKLSAAVWTVLLLIPLAATLLGEEVGGATRWLDLGVVNVNAAMLVLPALVIMLHRVSQPFPALLAAAAVLCLQPDLSQLAAFSAAMLPLLWSRRKERLFSLAGLLTLAASVVLCLLSPSSVEPVEYSEGVLAMLFALSPLLMAAGVVFLAAVPAFFGVRFLRLRQPHLLSLAAYYAVLMLFILPGTYPVPFIGFGLSPIAGYYLACLCGASARRGASN